MKIDESSRLDSQASRAIQMVLIAAILFVAAYAFWFGLINKRWLSEDPGNWGTFGDYVGGILNPLISALALFWLTKSIRVQKEELRETRMALAGAEEAQRIQVELSALTALSASISQEIATKQEHMMFIANQLSSLSHASIRNVDGHTIEPEATKSFLHEIHARIIYRIAEQKIIEDRINELLPKKINSQPT